MLITCPKCSAEYQIPDEVHLTVGRKLKCSQCQTVFALNEENQFNSEKNKADFSSEGVASSSGQTVVTCDEKKVFEDQPVFQDDVPQPFMPVASVEPESKNSVASWMAVISLLLLLGLLGVAVFYRDLLFDTFSPKLTMPVSQTAKVVNESGTKPQESVSDHKDKTPMTSYVEETPETILLPQIQSVRFEKRLDPTPVIRIEGVLKNGTSSLMKLPPKVRAIAYNAEGAILFEKEIYLTDSILMAGEERPFFGSYQPAPDGVQWVDVTF